MESKINMSFCPKIAKQVGTDAAIILSNIEFWMVKNKANNKNCHNGRYWTYNTINAWCELFDYLTENQIRRCLKKLEDSDLLLCGNFNKSSFDRTKWYSSNRKVHLSKCKNGSVQSDRPIPDINTNINTDIKHNTPVGGKSKDFHAPFIKIYFDWFLEKFKSKPKITVADTAASKQLINYFLNNEQDPLESLGAIFSHWHRLDDFTQKSVDLRKLNSNINSIIQQLTKKHEKRDKFNESISNEFGSPEGLTDFIESEWKSSNQGSGTF